MKLYCLMILLITFECLSSGILKGQEIRNSKFSIVYDAIELKYFSQIISNKLLEDMNELEKITGLQFKRKFLVNIYKNLDSLKDHHKLNTNEDILINLETASSLSIIFTPPNNYYSALPFKNYLQKKLLFVLFRQNKIPENIYFEEAFFEILLNERNGYGLVSIPVLKYRLPLPIKNMTQQNIKPIELSQNIKNTPESIKATVDKINFAKTILAYQKIKVHEKDSATLIKTTKLYIKNIKNENWMQKLNTIPNDNLLLELEKKRAIYNKIMENFNRPSAEATDNITQEYVFRMSLRFLLQNQSEIAYKLFQLLETTPPKNTYYSELGLFFSKKYKTDQKIWLEYFLLNQTQKKPVDFDNPDQVSNLLIETFAKEMPDFQVSEMELDFIRTIQFLIFLGKSELITELIDKSKTQSFSIYTKNLIWAIGIHLQNKTIVADFESNFKFFESRIWEETKAFKK